MSILYRRHACRYSRSRDFLSKSGNHRSSQNRKVLVRSLIEYERHKCNYSGIHFDVWHCCFARSECGSNFSGNRSSGRYAAGRKGLNRAWLGGTGESAPTGERVRAELRHHRRQVPGPRRLGANCPRLRVEARQSGEQRAPLKPGSIARAEYSDGSWQEHHGPR